MLISKNVEVTERIEREEIEQTMCMREAGIDTGELDGRMNEIMEEKERELGLKEIAREERKLSLESGKKIKSPPRV
ncbi:hypothetical protein TSUD_174060 [Trifolium subterraneum]|nr:hypothetical protein TSUD_174060 [Trifolium subterraneum]